MIFTYIENLNTYMYHNLLLQSPIERIEGNFPLLTLIEKLQFFFLNIHKE